MKGNIKTSSEISDLLQSRFGLTASVQVIHSKGENRTLYELEHIPFNRRMTMAGLERLCRRIAKALDAELCGTVNIDFASLGDCYTFDMLLEVRH
jgi:hypothetical protein